MTTGIDDPAQPAPPSAQSAPAGEPSPRPSAELSPYAASLLRAMTAEDAAADPIARQPVDIPRLSDRDLGALLPAAQRLAGRTPGSVIRSSVIRWAIQEAVRERQPVFTAASCVALFDALVEAAEKGERANPGLAVGALLRCDGPWPEQAARSARRLLLSLVGRRRLEHRYALLTLAALCGGVTQVAMRVLSRPFLEPTARDEVDLLFRLGVPALALVAEVAGDHPYDSMAPLPEAWARLAALPEYASFARQTLEAAAARAAEIQSGARPYEADKAFTRSEVEVLGRAARIALLRDEGWLAELLPALLRAIAVAPTAAKTLPSQALLYEIARAAEDHPTPEALEALRGARTVTRHKGVTKQLDRMLKRIERSLARRPGVALRLPDLGFDAGGTRVIEVGDHQAVITVSQDVETVWTLPDGKRSAAVPAAVRREHPDGLKAVRDLVKQARGQVGALARTLEAGYSAEATQPYKRWRDELVANPVGRSVARRLIWNLETGVGEWRAVMLDGDGAFHDVTGATVPAPEPGAVIRLWHPIGATVEEVRAWRNLFSERQLRQPFKQAFREIYLLTPAEEETETYSNRFAAHIVFYKQLYALIKARGWTTSMLGSWDGGDAGEAHGVYAEGAWRLVLRHEYLPEQPEGAECAGTDRAWFEGKEGGAWWPRRLDQVPAIVFSEAMRDVDLFVSVTSIAADPHWTDRAGADYADYWYRASVDELTASAKVRRAALERVIPRTRIADRCTLTDRYLVVRGELRTYKIHLGSANILMEPDDAYLCIVPSRRDAAKQVHLPFDEERLALILSKAFLLADDASITDQSIVAQLRRTH
jgi:Domain of unknown function (DUF4132)